MTKDSKHLPSVAPENSSVPSKVSESRTIAWESFMRHCAELGHGEFEKLKIQDGVPVMAEVVREKVKFT